MKKFLIVIVVIIIILLSVSGYTESNYCHTMTTTPPVGAPDDYIKNNMFCRWNAVPGAIGTVLINESFKDLVELVR